MKKSNAQNFHVAPADVTYLVCKAANNSRAMPCRYSVAFQVSWKCVQCLN